MSKQRELYTYIYPEDFSISSIAIVKWFRDGFFHFFFFLSSLKEGPRDALSNSAGVIYGNFNATRLPTLLTSWWMSGVRKLFKVRLDALMLKTTLRADARSRANRYSLFISAIFHPFPQTRQKINVRTFSTGQTSLCPPIAPIEIFDAFQQVTACFRSVLQV